MKEIIAQKKWFYTLYKDEKGLSLSVVCGGVGLFEVEVIFTAADVQEYEMNPHFLDEFSEKVRNNPKKFQQ